METPPVQLGYKKNGTHQQWPELFHHLPDVSILYPLSYLTVLVDDPTPNLVGREQGRDRSVLLHDGVG